MNFIHGAYSKPGDLVKIFGPLGNDQNKIGLVIEVIDRSSGFNPSRKLRVLCDKNDLILCKDEHVAVIVDE